MPPSPRPRTKSKLTYPPITPTDHGITRSCRTQYSSTADDDWSSTSYSTATIATTDERTSTTMTKAGISTIEITTNATTIHNPFIHGSLLGLVNLIVCS